MTRASLGNTARRALQAIAEHGPITLSHGVHYAEITRYGVFVMSPTNHLLRANGLVEWAGGNYSRWHVRITDYGRECLGRGSRDLSRRRIPPHLTYGPQT